MSQRDPFFTVKDEVQKTLTQAKTQYQRWCATLHESSTQSFRECELAREQLKVSLRNIDLDLEDLEQTISVVEQNPRRFQISDAEIRERRQFVEKTKSTVKDIRDHMSQPVLSNGIHKSHSTDGVRQALLSGSGADGQKVVKKNKYTRLPSSDDLDHTNTMSGRDSNNIPYTRLDGYDSTELSNDRFIETETQQNQQMILRSQDETLDMMGSSVHVLKGMSSQIGQELDEQSVMLDEFSHTMETTESKLDSNMKKIAKVLHMSNDRRQWIAIGVLALALFIVILLFIIT